MSNLKPYYQVKLTLLRKTPTKNEDEQYAYEIYHSRRQTSFIDHCGHSKNP